MNGSSSIPGVLALCLASWGPLGAALEERAPEAATEERTGGLAKASQNPVADMISIPFQDNIGLGYRPETRAPRTSSTSSRSSRCT